MKAHLLALTGLLTAFGAAAQAAGVAGTPLTLPGSQWQLVSMDNGGAVSPVVPDGAVTLDFTSETEFGGSGGCNTYGGTYEVSEGAIALSGVVSTRMACAEEGRMQQENAYFAVLEAATRYQLGVNRLTLFSDDGRALRFMARGAYALIGSQWELDAIGFLNADDMRVIGDKPLTLSFASATDVAAFGGCNGWGSTYETRDDEQLSILPGVGTLMACEDDEINQQEAVYFGLLGEAVAFEIVGDRLNVYTQNDQILKFTAAGEYALRRTQWVLDSMIVEGDTAVAPVAGSVVTLEFSLDGTAGGSAGCNSYGGSYTLDAESLTFSQVVSTLMACMDSAVMEQESRYLTALNNVVGYEIADGRLILHSTGGTLEFAQAGATMAPDEA